MATFDVLDDTRGGGACRSCHAPITWFVLAKSGKRMPFDGDVVYVRTRHEDGRLVGVVDGSINPSHFATCAQADSWRRR